MIHYSKLSHRQYMLGKGDRVRTLSDECERDSAVSDAFSHYCSKYNFYTYDAKKRWLDVAHVAWHLTGEIRHVHNVSEELEQ